MEWSVPSIWGGRTGDETFVSLMISFCQQPKHDDEKADQLAQRVMALEDQRMALRRKYYELMKKALPTVLVVRFFQVENQIQLIVDLQIASNLPIIEEAQ